MTHRRIDDPGRTRPRDAQSGRSRSPTGRRPVAPGSPSFEGQHQSTQDEHHPSHRDSYAERLEVARASLRAGRSTHEAVDAPISQRTRAAAVALAQMRVLGEPPQARRDLRRLERALEQNDLTPLEQQPPLASWSWAKEVLAQHKAGVLVPANQLALAEHLHTTTLKLESLKRLTLTRRRLHQHYEKYGHFEVDPNAVSARTVTPKMMLTRLLDKEVLAPNQHGEVLNRVRTRATKLMEVVGHTEDSREALALYHLCAEHLRDYCRNQPNNDALRGALSQMRAMYVYTYGDALAFDPPELPPSAASS